MRHLPLVNMQAAEFSATMQGRENLARVEQMIRIKGAFQALLLFQVNFGEHLTHQITLFDTDTVLTGEDTAQLNTVLEDRGTKGFGAFKLTFIICNRTFYFG